jgi:hypothetical protein
MVVNATLLGFHRKRERGGIVSGYGLGVASTYFNDFYFGFIW